MNIKHVRSLVVSALPLSFPLLAACNGPVGESGDMKSGEGSVGVAAQAVVSGMSRISGGYRASLALRPDGTVWSSGDNSHGQLGDGTTSRRTSPVRVGGLDSVVAVSAGLSNYSLALKADGTVVSWGSNLWWQLGVGSYDPTEDEISPVAIDGLSGVVAVTAAHQHALAVKSNGTVWSWGIGVGTVPAQVSGLSGITAVAGGAGHSLALKSNGTVFAWGSNSYGQLGQAMSITSQATPAQVDGLSGVTAVAAGWYSSLALKSDGTVWAWGNTTYQAWQCTPAEDPTVPAQVDGLEDITAIAAGEYDMLALKADGTVLAWGWNPNGGLGDGTNQQRCAPVPVSGLSGVTAISVGQIHSLALRSDGTIFAWGGNADGQLGDGTTVDRYAPVATTLAAAADCSDCASWPMPNPASTGLPHPASYTSQSGYVVDDVTGLEWQAGTGCSSGCTQADAAAYCEALSLGGHDDWRLPTRLELVSIVDDTEHAPAVDTSVFSAPSSGLLWTSTPMIFFPNAPNAFRVGSGEGHTAYGGVNGLGPVRCVRAPYAPATSEYTIQAGGTAAGTVLDTGTGLTWQQAVSSQTFSWSDAISYCSNNAAGLPGSGWRLPSMKELQTIVDDGHVSPAIDASAFPSTPIDVAYWTSTPVAWQQGHAWHVLFNIGQSAHSAAASTYHVRCVR